MDILNDKEEIMTSEKAVQILTDLRALGVEVILDGGWGVDALLRKQTREHKDLDFLVEKKDVEKLKKYFHDHGYAEAGTNTWWHFMLENKPNVVDIHVIEIDEAGNGTYGPKENGAFFPADGLHGSGEIDGLAVNSLTPEYRIKCLTMEYGIVARNGYKVTKKDYIDMLALCNAFSIELPVDFKKFQKKDVA